MPRYDRAYGREYGRATEDRGRYPSRGPAPFTGWYPGAYWAGAPMFGWMGLEPWAWPPYAPYGPYGANFYGADYTPRRRPEESPTYGRGGDEAARRWAERYGYDIEYSIRPRRSGRRR